MQQARFVLLLAALVLPAAGCTTTTVVDASSIPARSVGADFAEEQLLDVGVALFDAGVPADELVRKRKMISPEIRRAEASFLAYNLRDTLERTENWGAVRIMPRESRAIDLMVYGTIMVSNGIELGLSVRAVDAAGDVWLDREYDDVASTLSYREDVADDEDPFQDIYNRVADDLLAAYLEREPADITRIRKTALLHFAEDIAPYAFDDYLSEGKRGERRIERLPADGDPMLGRVQKIRDREHMFIDLLDEHYKAFHSGMQQPYMDWRKYSYEELVQLREMRRAALTTTLIGAATVAGGMAVSQNAETRVGQVAGRAGVFAGASGIAAGLRIRKDAKIHSETMRQLDESFLAEVDPMVVEVEGQTTELSGSAQEQFDEWRRLLRRIYQRETGIDLTEQDSEPALPQLGDQL